MNVLINVLPSDMILMICHPEANIEISSVVVGPSLRNAFNSILPDASNIVMVVVEGVTKIPEGSSKVKDFNAGFGKIVTLISSNG